MKRGKKYLEASKLIDRTTKYAIDEAVQLAKKTSTTKFDSSVEIAFRLNLDPRQADQNLRGAIVLPHGTGRVQRVAVIAKGEQAISAKEAGADHVGDVDLIQQIEKGWFDFDVLVATPDMMPQLGRLGRVLGPKGLMPNPRTGTVTADAGKAVQEIKAGKIEYRVDKVGNIHSTIGKVSFTEQQLKENVMALYELMTNLRPSTVKGKYMKNITLSTTMGPGIKVDEDSLKTKNKE